MRQVLAVSLAGIVAVVTAIVQPAGSVEAAIGPSALSDRALSACFSLPPEPLTALTTDLQAALDGAGLAVTDVTATSNVHECHPRPQDGPPMRSRSTGIVVRTPAAGPVDRDALGVRIAEVVDAIRPVLAAPGAASPMTIVTVSMVAPEGNLDHKANWHRLVAARDQGLTGAALVDVK